MFMLEVCSKGGTTMSNHDLSTIDGFTKAFAQFVEALRTNNIDLNGENQCRLFDIWLDNSKDERLLALQEKAAEDEGQSWR
jgi:hypothetical protein